MLDAESFHTFADREGAGRGAPAAEQSRRERRHTGWWPGVAGLAACLACAVAADAEVMARTTHFAFHSDLATNVHDALLQAGRDRNGGRPGLFAVGAEQACFAGLPNSARSAWGRAVDYYAEIVSPSRFSERPQFLIRLDLGRLEAPRDERSRSFVEIARGFIAVATPAFVACRWEAQDAANREWAAGLVALLEEHEAAVAGRLAELYRMPLAGLPIRVDVVETVNWSGATTILLDPAGGHILTSRSERGPAALELIFHEASHTLMGRSHPLRRALAGAAESLDLPLPGDLWHAVLFYSTGDAVRRVLSEAGEPEYTPMLFEGGLFARHHAALRRAWTPYLDGERTLDEAALDLMRAAQEGTAGGAPQARGAGRP
jgi:hypothetical protein